MAALTTKVSRDLDADVTVMRPIGRLDLLTAPRLRSALLKCVAECPSAIVVDLSDCVAESPAALTVLPAVAAHQAAQPSVALLLCRMSPPPQGAARAALGPLPVHQTLADALAAAADARRLQQRVRLHVGRSFAAPAVARDAIGEACDRWGLSDLGYHAMLIISELVTNAIRHAESEADVEAALRDDFLHLRVSDSSAAPPVIVGSETSALADHGRGMAVVAHYSAAWGFVINSLGTGKVVWATLRTRPLRS